MTGFFTGELRMSGTARECDRSLAPAVQGEQIPGITASEGNLPPLSRLWSRVRPFACVRSMGILILCVLMPPTAGGNTGASGDPRTFLAPVVEDLRALCGCDTLRVDWRGLDRIWRAAQALDSLSISSPLPSRDPDRKVDRIVVRLRGLRSGRPVEVMLPGDVFCLDSVHRTRRSLRRGEIVGATDTELVRGWFSPSAVWRGKESVEGLHVLNSVSIGTPLASSDLGPAPWVRRGETLRVVYSASSLHLEVRGVARADGWEGDRIRLRVDGGGRDCEGVVVGPGLVRVQPEGGF